MVHINSKNFDESVIFCGRGHEKNNFLMELYLKNETDKNTIFDVFDALYPRLLDKNKICSANLSYLVDTK